MLSSQHTSTRSGSPEATRVEMERPVHCRLRVEAPVAKDEAEPDMPSLS